MKYQKPPSAKEATTANKNANNGSPTNDHAPRPVRLKASAAKIRAARGKLRGCGSGGTEAFLRDRHSDAAHGY